jgi:hypothetical protein
MRVIIRFSNIMGSAVIKCAREGKNIIYSAVHDLMKVAHAQEREDSSSMCRKM